MNNNWLNKNPPYPSKGGDVRSSWLKCSVASVKLTMSHLKNLGTA